MKRLGHAAAAACGIGVELVALQRPAFVMAGAVCPLLSRTPHVVTHITQSTENTEPCEENTDAS